MNWYIKCFKQYADFRGRARREEYWNFVLFNIIISLTLTFISFILGLTNPDTYRDPLSSLYSLIAFVPGLAVSVRRLHDIGKSGWYILLVLIPILGWIALIYLHFKDGDPYTNEYGEDPKNRNYNID